MTANIESGKRRRPSPFNYTIEAKSPAMLTLRAWWPPILWSIVLLLIVVIVMGLGNATLHKTLTDALIKLMVVVGLFVFIGNSGILSFGHIGFMMIGAYAAAWQTCCPKTKKLFIPGLPDYLLTHQFPFMVSVIVSGLLAAFIALIAGSVLMRLSGIAASIGTFAFLMVMYAFYLRWDPWTRGASTMTGLPVHTDSWVMLGFCVVVMFGAFVYARSRYGLSAKASRDDEVASKAAGVNVVGQRLLSFVVSAFIVGMAGALFGHFLGILTVDSFGLPYTFITLSMLVVGGMQSLSGAVLGAIVISTLFEALRQLEIGFNIGGSLVALPGGGREVGIGILMLVILIFRRNGLTANQEVYWPFRGDAMAKTAMSRRS
ncbi:MAG: branched-chain amino acid ABC transporter permease [Alphaproteobacteria bacterium]|nr:branched-chain amino acid ABC transporter permease [Alphaproteobacteria bacterium]